MTSTEPTRADARQALAESTSRDQEAALDLAGARVWVVVSHGDAGAFATAAFTTREAALDWANETEVQDRDEAAWEPDGDGAVWDDGELTVRVTPLPVENGA